MLSTSLRMCSSRMGFWAFSDILAVSTSTTVWRGDESVSRDVEKENREKKIDLSSLWDGFLQPWVHGWRRPHLSR